MPTYEVYLRPSLLVNIDGKLNHGLKTGNKNLDSLVMSKLKKNVLKVEEIVESEMFSKKITKTYKPVFDGEVYMVQVDTCELLDEDETFMFKDSFLGNGADTWMEGNINFLYYEELENKKYKPNKFSKLGRDVELDLTLVKFVEIM